MSFEFDTLDQDEVRRVHDSLTVAVRNERMDVTVLAMVHKQAAVLANITESDRAASLLVVEIANEIMRALPRYREQLIDQPKGSA